MYVLTSPSRHHLITFSALQKIEEQFKLSYTLEELSEGVNALAISPDGISLLSACNDGQAFIWNLLTGEHLQKIDCAFNGPISCIAWRDTREAFVLGCADGSIHLYRWSATKGLYIYVLQESAHKDAVQSIAYDSYHKRIASISKTSLQVWNCPDSLDTLKLLINHPLVSNYHGRTIHFCDDGASVISTYLESHQM
ncbi:WD40 repeat-like protein [Athelia psychrophila]|uniref:WD40 repeat-like protein n=1 Tax=Athelia psychrophila TaxID=1759441 RepID=A0A165Z4D0_9AGAM|nr:WD40 repeat-like protein [Fibularhizoctonia sp. CBS 109695]